MKLALANNVSYCSCFKLQVITIWLFVCASISFQLAMANSTTLSKSIADFSSELYQNVIKEKNGNIIMSPLSVQIALSLAYAGAEGETATVLSKGIKLIGQTKDEVANDFKELLGPLQNDASVKIANSIYVMDGHKVEPKYEKTAVDQYFSLISTLNFADNVKSANTINSWVESKTNNKIKDLISPDKLDSLTRLVLVNAIYFKGFWKHQFDKARTTKAPFYTDENNSVQVDMMHVKENFLYGRVDSLDAEVIELPYQDSDISMLIILPSKRNGLPELEAKLGSFDLSTLREQMWSQKVDVSIPKFKIEFEISLPETLKKMGMGNIFSDEANFNGLLQAASETNLKEHLKVSEVIHKAFIEVNEEGAEAAAATGVVFMTRCMPMPPMVFNADHSFIYFLWNNKKSIYFMGRISTMDDKN